MSTSCDVNRPGEQKREKKKKGKRSCFGDLLEGSKRGSEAKRSATAEKRRLSVLLTNIFLQADAGQHGGQVVVAMGRDLVQVGGRRVVHVVRGHPDLSNAVLARDNTEVHLGTEHRRGRFLPQVRGI